VESSP
jgi:hypothetical protein